MPESMQVNDTIMVPTDAGMRKAVEQKKDVGSIGYLVEATDNGYLWVKWLMHSEFSMMIGDAHMENGVLVLGTYKVHDDPPKETDSPQKVREYLASLPVWDKAKYYIKFMDVGPSYFQDCKNGEEVGGETEGKLAEALGMVRAV
jgi:hypothetical protein